MSGGRGKNSRIAVVGGGIFIAVVVCALIASAVGPIVADLTASRSSQDDPFQPTTGQQGSEYQNVLQTAVAASPDDPVNQISLARLLTLGGETTAAFDHYQRAVDLDPNNPDYRVDFGRALADARHYPDAEVQYQRAVALDPNSPEAYYWLGELYRTWQPPRAQEAESAFRRAIALSPGSVSGRLAQESLQRMTNQSATPGATPAAATP